MNFTNKDSVVKEIDVPRYWEWRLAFGDDRLYGKINNKRVYCQVHNHLCIPRILSIQNTISEEIER